MPIASLTSSWDIVPTVKIARLLSEGQGGFLLFYEVKGTLTELQAPYCTSVVSREDLHESLLRECRKGFP